MGIGTGHITKEQRELRNRFDEEVWELYRQGCTKEEISILLNASIQRVSFSLHRLEHGKSYPDGGLVPRGRDAEIEADLLINAKLAPIHKPKVKKVRVDGWENGRYVHYTAYDVSEYWGL